MNVFGQLIKASLEKVSSDLSETFEGLLWYNTTSKQIKYRNDSTVKTVVDTDTTQTLSNKEHDVSTFSQQSTPGVNPATGKVKLYLKNDKRMYLLTETGAEKLIGDEQDVFVLDEQSGTPATPATGKIKVYTKSTDKLMYMLNSLGVETLLTNQNLTGDVTSVGASTTLAITVPVAKGGTGATTLTANNVILGNGTSAVQVVAPGTSGNVLTSNGTTWTSTASATAGYSPTIQAGITITGVTSNPTKGTTSVDRIVHSRVGAWLKAIYQYEQSAAGASGSGDYLFQLPSGLSFDSTFVQFYTGTIISVTASQSFPKAIVGHGAVGMGVGSGYLATATLIAYDSTRFRVIEAYGNGGTLAGINPIAATLVGDLGANNRVGYGFFLEAPISGW